METVDGGFFGDRDDEARDLGGYMSVRHALTSVRLGFKQVIAEPLELFRDAV